ncbi:hypothetical protein ScPMuIL_009845 [Solemya velum]
MPVVASRFVADFADVSDSPSKTFMVVGLGNHDHLHTRHSVGMLVVEQVAEIFKTSPWKKNMEQCAGYVSKGEIGRSGLKIVLLKPKMPMNVNGTSVSRTAHHFDVPSENIFLVHDDIDKKLGKIVIKEGGSANGHNGVRSVMNSLRADVMPRFRIGVDRPSTKSEVAEYVLSNFNPSERDTVRKVINECVDKVIHRIEQQSGVCIQDQQVGVHLSEGT